MVIAAQDDAREREMRSLFNLDVPLDRRRADIDAYLEMEGVADPLPFELKSSTSNNISTVRDLGPAHIAKWRHLHWLFGFYDSRGEQLQYCIYASPADMRPWVDEKQAYIKPDLVLAERAPELITDAVLTEILGPAEAFTAVDAKSIMKNQWSAALYEQNSDLPDGMFSRSQMLRLLQQRCGYVLRRGATLNNPHIPNSFFQGFTRITRNHASTLRQLVQSYLDQAAVAEDAGAEPPEGTTDPVVAQAAQDTSQA